MAISVRWTSAKPVEEKKSDIDERSSSYAAEYYDDEDYDESEFKHNSKCQNGGYVILESDWCACGPRFTGRYCEIEIEPDNINGCGTSFSFKIINFKNVFVFVNFIKEISKK